MNSEMDVSGRSLSGACRRIAILWILSAAMVCRGRSASISFLEYVPGLVAPFEVRGWGLTGDSVVAGYRLGQIVNSPEIVAGSIQWTGSGVSLVVSNANFSSTGVPGNNDGTDTNAFVTVFNLGANATFNSFNSVTVRALDSNAVQQFSQSARVVGVACGEFHTLLLRRDGTVGATGWNAVGQTNVPAAVTNVASIACGLDHSIAIRRDGTAVVWGTPRIRGTPLVESLAPPDEENHDLIASGGGALHSIFLRRDGRVLVAGRGFQGVMAPPRMLTNTVAIAAGAYHNIALTRDGRVVEWGYPTDDSPDDDGNGEWPRIRRLKEVVAVAAGGMFSMALHADRTVTAWGDAEYGETDVPESATNVVAIAAGTYHALALRADGTVVAWGATEGGVTTVPTGLTNVVAIAAGGYHNQVLVQTQPVLTWPRVQAGHFLAEVNLPAGARYRLEAVSSEGLWHPVSTNVAWPGSMVVDVPIEDRSVLLMRASPLP